MPESTSARIDYCSPEHPEFGYATPTPGRKRVLARALFISQRCRLWFFSGARPDLPYIGTGSSFLLRLIPKSWLSWDFTVLDESHAVADIDVSWWREKGMLTVQGASYTVYREGLICGDFILESAGSLLARAQKPSVFRRCFIIEHAGRRYTLRAKSAFKRLFVLLDDSIEIGTISPEGIFTRRATVDLPEDMLLPVKIFVIWLAVILWKRESEAGAAAGGA